MTPILASHEAMTTRPAYWRVWSTRAFMESMSTLLTIYSTSWCSYCRRLKRQLEISGISYEEMNIEEDPAAAEFVLQANQGQQIVPTVKYPDGSTATNPSIFQVKAALGIS